MNLEQYRRGCMTCNRVRDDSGNNPLTEDTCLVIHCDAELINPFHQGSLKQDQQKQRKRNRDIFSWVLKLHISALRNSGGGAVLVHLSGLERQDSYLDYFHELVDPRLHEIIEDGSLFVEIYRKNWMHDIYSDITDDEDDTVDAEVYKDIVAVIVLPSYSVVTVTFNTKVPLDNQIVNPSSIEVYNFIKRANRFGNTNIKIRGLVSLQESRHVQVKSYFVDPQNIGTINTPLVLANFIWQDLKLGQYISAFSKVDGGGSFYLGIAETAKTYPSYVTKYYDIIGFVCPKSNHEKLERHLRQLIAAETAVLYFDNDVQPSPLSKDSVGVVFHSVPGRDCFVLEVAVAAVNGLVFYTREGPEAYKIVSEDEVRRLDLPEWRDGLLRG